jgi:predicted small metal-binding protein
MKTFECRHGGILCGAKLHAETDEELLRKAVEHARERHEVDLAQSQTLLRYAQSLVRTEG